MSTPSMTFRSLNSQGDWMAGQGASSYATGLTAVALNVQTACQTFLGDAFWSATFGIDWLTLLGQRGTQNAILAQVRNVIANCEGVTAIVSVSATFTASTRKLVISYVVDTIYSAKTAGNAQVTL